MHGAASSPRQLCDLKGGGGDVQNGEIIMASVEERVGMP
jgi:hypothetical protein